MKRFELTIQNKEQRQDKQWQILLQNKKKQDEKNSQMMRKNINQILIFTWNINNTGFYITEWLYNCEESKPV